jgi:hypothetical protein
MAPVEGAVLVSDGAITVKVSLTSPLLREPAGKFLSGVITRLANDQKVMKSFAISSYQFHVSCVTFQQTIISYFIVL